MSLTNSLTAVSGVVSGASNILQGLSSIGTVLLSGDFWSQLRPASYRGVPFAVLEGEAVFGRRNAIHTYPFRDGAWVEDMGKQARRITLIGFVVGDDAIAKRNALIQAVESPGNGELVHATLGRMTVNVLEFASHERWDKGRMFEVRLVCMTSVPRIWPATSTSTPDAVSSAVKALGLSSAASFVSRVVGALKYADTVALQAVATVKNWVNRALSIARAASSAYHLIAGVGSLISEFSRALSGFSLAAESSQSQAAAIGSPTTAAAFASSAQGAVASAVAATGSPRDQINAAVLLSSYQTPTAATVVGIPQAGTVAADQTALLFRRAAVAQMAQAAATYQPTSSDEASAIQVQVVSAIEAAILEAGDAGDDAVYADLLNLRTAVMQDMNAKGASLPAIEIINVNASLPSLVLAQRLYQDAARADDLAQRAQAIHPAFMPQRFKALSS